MRVLDLDRVLCAGVPSGNRHVLPVADVVGDDAAEVASIAVPACGLPGVPAAGVHAVHPYGNPVAVGA